MIPAAVSRDLPVPPQDRTARALCREVRSQPGFGLRVTALVAMCVSAAARSGLGTMVVVVGCSAVASFGLGFVRFRKRGYLW